MLYDNIANSIYGCYFSLIETFAKLHNVYIFKYLVFAQILIKSLNISKLG